MANKEQIEKRKEHLSPIMRDLIEKHKENTNKKENEVTKDGCK